VREHVEDEEMFLANYADTLTDAPLDEMVKAFADTDATASMLAVPPFSSHHVVEIDDDGHVTGIREFRDLTQWENGGYFVMRPTIFDVLHEGEDIVPHALNRLYPSGQLMAQRYTGFWRAVDTFKDRAEMEDVCRRGAAPWMLWKNAQRTPRMRPGIMTPESEPLRVYGDRSSAELGTCRDPIGGRRRSAPGRHRDWRRRSAARAVSGGSRPESPVRAVRQCTAKARRGACGGGRVPAGRRRDIRPSRSA